MPDGGLDSENIAPSLSLYSLSLYQHQIAHQV